MNTRVGIREQEQEQDERTFMVRWVDVDTIQDSGFNPEGRSDVRRYDDLVLSMQRHGYLQEHPVLVGRDGRLGDGHRRVAAARKLGIRRITMVQSDRTSEELMADNAAQKTIRTNVWTDLTRVIPQEDWPRRIQVARRTLIIYTGERGWQLVQEQKASAMVATTLRQLLNYIGIGDQNAELGYRALRWMVINQQRRVVIEAMEAGVAPEILRQAIDEDRRLLPNGWQLGPEVRTPA